MMNPLLAAKQNMNNMMSGVKKGLNVSMNVLCLMSNFFALLRHGGVGG